ncbi:hypothetical protein PRIPAC_81222 [Pristionchus pacificus]|uniref:RING-type domain-containing protein n=1 Tax=Pristionchus pacificus TaxID=54126 RepID=A0A2A6BI71_PRIPA|nr:hypothetical protein PRIPAC_81222 [Pristionchus pacificus]|eukprot:PDM65592.1 hypothetical protein PRIPAC_52534 [Pristionchus pacificus]
MSWSPGEKERLTAKIANWRDENETNESLGVNGLRFSRECRGCRTNSICTRFACLQCKNLFCGDCSNGKCKQCETSSTFVKLIENVENYRECSLCCCEAPVFRIAFADCGHTCCEACAHQMHMNAVDNGVRLACHLCRTVVESFPIFLVEVVPVAGEPCHKVVVEDCVASRTRSSLRKKANTLTK